MQPIPETIQGLKPCPFCSEEIRCDAVKCRFCGEWLSQPPRQNEVPQKQEWHTSYFSQKILPLIVFAIILISFAVGGATLTNQKNRNDEMANSDSLSSPIASPPNGNPSDQIKIGNIVAANTGGSLILATVESLNSVQNTITVISEKNQRFTITLDKITLIPGDQNLQIGDYVVAVWSDSRMYPGTISAINGGNYMIKWDDGGTPLNVPARGILKVPNTPPSSATPAGTTNSSTTRFEVVRREIGQDWVVIQVRVHGNASKPETEAWSKATASKEYPAGNGQINFYSSKIDADHLIASFEAGSLYMTR